MNPFYLRKTAEISVLSSLVFVPLVFYPAASDPFWVTEEFTLKFWFLLSALLFGAYVLLSKKIFLIKAPFLAVMALFTALTVFGAIKAYNYAYFWGRVLVFVSVFGMAAIITYLSAGERGEAFPEKVIFACILSAFLSALYGLMQSAGADFFSWSNTFAGRAAGTFGNPNFLAGHMLGVIPFAFFAAFREGIKPYSRLFYITAASVMTAALVLSQTRSAFLGLLASCAVFLVFAARLSRELKGIKTAAMITVIAVVMVAVYSVSDPVMKKRFVDALRSGDEAGIIRISLWKNTMHMIKDSPLLGAAAGNFAVKYPHYQSASLESKMFEKTDYYKSSHAHNDYLHLISEFGVPAAGIFFLLLFWFVYNAGKRVLSESETGKIQAISFLCAAAGILVHAFFNFPFLINPTLLVFFALAAASFGSGYDPLVEEKELKNQYLYYPVLIALFVLAAFQPHILAGSAYLRAAKQFEYINNPAAAVGYAVDAVNINPDDDELRIYLAGLYKKAGNMEGALKEYEAASMLNRGSWDAHFELTNAYISAGNFEKAEKTALNCFLISPYSPRAITSLGYVFFRLNRPNDALPVFERGIGLWPESSDMYYQLSATYGALKDDAKALELAKKAVEKEQPQPGAYFNLAIAYYKSGMLKEAVATLKQIKTNMPQYASQADNLLKAFNNAEKK